jgi:hypothetical protein
MNIDFQKTGCRPGVLTVIGFIVLMLLPARSDARSAADPAISSADDQTELQDDPYRSRFFPVDSPPQLSVFTPSGNIEVVSNPSLNGVQVDLYVKREFSFWGRSGSLDNYRIIIQKKGGSIVASVEDRRGGSVTSRSEQVQFLFVIQVPDKGMMNLRSMNGEILLSGVEGQHFLQNHNGTIRVQNSSGEIRVASSSGDIQLDRLSGNIYAKNVSGAVHSTDIQGELRLKTISGEVTASGIRGALIAETISGDIRSAMENISAGVHLETISGNIDLTLPRESGYTIDATAMNYDFAGLVDEPTSQNIRPRSARLEIRDGGIPVKLSTLSGTIRILESQ